MFKKYLTAALACSLITCPLKTEESNESYLKQLWSSFTKRMSAIAQYEGPYAGSFCIGTMVSAATSFKLWLSRNDMIEKFARDANGNLISNWDESFTWFKKIEESGAKAVKIIPNARFTQWTLVSDTGESFDWIMETKLEPITSQLTYKLFFGIAGIASLIALYSAYKIFNTPDKAATEVIQEN